MATINDTKKKKHAAKSKGSVAPEPTAWQPPPAKRPDIFMTLPPELRNIIYEDVLSDTLPISVHPARKVPTAWGLQLSIWREPPLLRVSQAIRSEASTIYFGTNDFDVEIPLDRMAELSTGMRRLVGRCGVRPFRSLRILIISANWYSMDNGRLLAKLFHQSGLLASPGTRTHQRKWSAGSRLDAHMVHNCYGLLQAALRASAELGERGAREAWSEDEMESRLDTWMEVCEINRAKRSSPKELMLALQA
ncbi:hypothetical protein LTR17_009498 [Elasticomyces elasticus]|nr:hypothetical protein LTR17_009498 [Elasticomyces elasticus]